VLYRPDDFEPLVDEPWDEGRIRAGIEEIVADTEDAYRGPKLLWRADAWDRWRATSPRKTLYCGAAGVVWALDELRQRGHAETRLDRGRRPEHARAPARPARVRHEGDGGAGRSGAARIVAP
jgi:hypothetical protein